MSLQLEIAVFSHYYNNTSLYGRFYVLRSSVLGGSEQYWIVFKLFFMASLASFYCYSKC